MVGNSMKEEEKFDSQIFFARASGARNIWNIQTIYRRGERAHKLPIVSQFNWRNVSEDKFFCQFNTHGSFQPNVSNVPTIVQIQLWVLSSVRNVQHINKTK